MDKNLSNYKIDTSELAINAAKYLEDLKQQHPNDERFDSTNLTFEEVLETINAASVWRSDVEK
jgi:alpha-acetolactate decarboxylase